MSILIRIYGSDVFYSELDTKEKLLRLGEFLRAPRDKLVYSDVDAIRNLLLIDSRVRQPLSNGLEFNTFMDTSMALFIAKESKKTDSENKREFQVNNFYRFAYLNIPKLNCRCFFVVYNFNLTKIKKSINIFLFKIDSIVCRQPSTNDSKSN